MSLPETLVGFTFITLAMCALVVILGTVAKILEWIESRRPK